MITILLFIQQIKKLNNTKTNIKSPDAKGYAFRRFN